MIGPKSVRQAKSITIDLGCYDSTDAVSTWFPAYWKCATEKPYGMISEKWLICPMGRFGVTFSVGVDKYRDGDLDLMFCMRYHFPCSAKEEELASSFQLTLDNAKAGVSAEDIADGLEVKLVAQHNAICKVVRDTYNRHRGVAS